MSLTPSIPNSPPYLVDGKTDAQRYLEDCLDGKIIVCDLVKKFADKMLPRITDGYKQWHFDLDEAFRPLRFCEKFCRIPSGKKSSQPFILEPYERMPVELAYGFVDDDGNRQIKEVFIQWARKCGKGLALTEELPTPSGWRKMGDLRVGDVVFGQDGKPSTIIAESEIFDKPTYLVTFGDGSHIKATDDHIWTVYDTNRWWERDAYGIWRDVTTQEMYDNFLDDEGFDRYSIPTCLPVEYPESVFTTSPSEIGRLVSSDELDSIPEEYLVGSVHQRYELLAGLSELFFNGFRTGYRFKHKSKSVTDSVRELCSSLGYLTYDYPNTPDGEYCFTVKFYGFMRLDEYEPNNCGIDITTEPFRRYVKSIERIPNEPTKCIAIDNPSHLYLTGRQYIATHNTSLLAALNLYMLLSDNPNERIKECYNAASSDAQARLCYGATDAMAKMSPVLGKRLRRGMVQKRGVSGLNDDKTGSYLCTVSANGKKLDGLNSFFAVYDELAVCEDGGMIYDLITESMAGEHLRSPMLWIISTENYIRDNIFDERKNYSIGWLEGRIEDDTLLPLIYQLDSRDEIYDESKWIKASPGLGVTKSYSYLRERIAKAQQSPARMPSLLCKEFNLHANAFSSFLDINDCINNTPIDYEQIGIPPYVCVGFDLAARNDLCAAVCRWRVPGSEDIYEMAKFWIASDVLNMETDAKQKDKVPYLLWSSDGQKMTYDDGDTTWHYVEVVEGDRVNQSVIIDFLRDLVSVGMYPYCVAYDPWHVDDYTERTLKRYVGETRVFAVPQTARVISPLMRTHELDLKAHKVICDNPCLHHNRASVQARVDNNDNIFPKKKDLQPHQKIDGFMAELFALAAEQKFYEEYISVIGWEPPETSDEQ